MGHNRPSAFEHAGLSPMTVVAVTQTRGYTAENAVYLFRWSWLDGTSSNQAATTNNSDCLPNGRRPGRSRSRHDPQPAGRQHDWIYLDASWAKQNRFSPRMTSSIGKSAMARRNDCVVRSPGYSPVMWLHDHECAVFYPRDIAAE